MTPSPDNALHYPLGKLPQADLISLLRHTIGAPDPRVVLGPGLGRDAAVIDFGDRYLVAKSDPITFATDEIGWYAVNVNANDVACLGAQPRWFIATLLLPESHTDRLMVDRIFAQLHAASHEIGATVVGGHTEITQGLDRPIIAGTMFGEVAPEHLVRSDGARPGDALVLTKGISVEGTALLAREMAVRLRGTVDSALLERAAQFLHDPGISVVRDAAIVASTGAVHAMHDPTEGGVATGLHEITEAAGVGAAIDTDALPFYPETSTICEALNLDPLGLIASGSLLAAVDATRVAEVVATLEATGIRATVIGSVRKAPGVVLRGVDGERPLRTFPRDEIARLFDAQ